MKVEFAIRSNVTFNGLHDDDSPIHGKAVTFRARDCLHIKAVRFELEMLARVFVMQLPLSSDLNSSSVKSQSSYYAAVPQSQHCPNINRPVHNMCYSIGLTWRDNLSLNNNPHDLHSLCLTKRFVQICKVALIQGAYC